MQLRVKIKAVFGPPPTFLGVGLSILVFFWNPSPVGSVIGRGLKNRRDTYSFALTTSLFPFAHMPLLIYFGVGSRKGRSETLKQATNKPVEAFKAAYISIVYFEIVN